MFVCLSVSVSVRERYLRNYTSLKSTNFFVHVTRGRRLDFAVGVAICYVLPVLWMMSCLQRMA